MLNSISPRSPPAPHPHVRRSMHDKNLLPAQKCEAFRMSLCISWCISSFHSRPTTPSFLHPRTPTIICPPLPPPPLCPLYLQDLNSLLLPLLISLSPPQGMSHTGLWMNMCCASTNTCPAYSDGFQSFRVLGEFACCDWHLLRWTVSVCNGARAEFS